MHSCSKCRYVVAALLVSKGKQESRSDKWASQLDQIRKLIQNEEYQYSDPVTDFVKAVFCSYDFDLAQVRCPTQLGCFFLIPFHNCPLYLLIYTSKGYSTKGCVQGARCLLQTLIS
jgi:hypothetical protein